MLTDPILVFAVLGAVAMSMPLLAERLRVPDIALLLLAGAALGPYGSGLLPRDAAINLFGSVGLLYIMFLAGLEIDLHRFNQTRSRSLGFGLLTFAIPQTLGSLLGRYVLDMDWTASILLASMFASHTLLAYPIASRLGLAKSEPVAVAVGATVITDILALTVLAVVANKARGLSLGLEFWLGTIFGMAALAVLLCWALPWVARRFFRHVPEKGGAQFLFVLSAMCGCAYLSHFARVEPIIGAFLVGVAFNRLIPPQSALMNRTEFVGSNIFIPFFLVSVGMLVDFKALTGDPHCWLVAGTMVVAVIGTKWLAARLAGKLYGYSSAGANMMFGLSVVQAAATLAAVLVGCNLGIFDSAVLNGAIAMILVTCPLGSLVVDRQGRAMAASAASKAVRPANEQRILVSVANPKTVPQLMDFALLLRNPALPGELQAVNIVCDNSYDAATVAQGEKLLARCLSRAAAVEMPLKPNVRIGLNVSDGLLHAAKELRADTVLLGWGGGRSGSGHILGTVLGNLLEECPARLAICRFPRPLNTTQRILLAFPPMAARRLDLALSLGNAKWLAKQIGASLEIYLCDPPAAIAQFRALAERATPTVPYSFHASPGWAELRSSLIADLRPDDLAILPLVRRFSPYWTPGINRLPAFLAGRFPDLNLVAVYPPIVSRDDEDDDTVGDELEDIELVPAGGGVAASPEEAIAQMTQATPGWTRSRRKATATLLAGAASDYPIELSHGTVFLNAHSDTVTTPTLLVWTGGGSLAFPGCSTPVRNVLALLSPSDYRSERHLRALSELARRFRDPAVAEAARAAATADELCRAIKP